MRFYTVLKPLYNERYGRNLQPGELVELDDRQAAILAAKGIIGAGYADKAHRRYSRKRDAELYRIEDSDL